MLFFSTACLLRAVCTAFYVFRYLHKQDEAMKTFYFINEKAILFLLQTAKNVCYKRYTHRIFLKYNILLFIISLLFQKNYSRHRQQLFKD